MEKLIRKFWKNYLRAVEAGLIFLCRPLNWLVRVFFGKWDVRKQKRVRKTENRSEKKALFPFPFSSLPSVIRHHTSNLEYYVIWHFKNLKQTTHNLQSNLSQLFTKNISKNLSKTTKILKTKIDSIIHEGYPVNFPKVKLPIIKFSKLGRSITNYQLQIVNTSTPHSLRFYKAVSVISLTIALLITFANSSYAFYYYVLKDLPSPERLTTSSIPQTTKIYARGGELLYKIYGRQNRSWLKLSDIPQNVVDATISVEDKNFYTNPGFSVTGILRAALRQAQGEAVQGGSTITQQLVKNVFLSPERTWARKVKELVLALETEKRYSKDEILEMYLNVVGYGGQAYGIEAAAEQYFDKPAAKLTLAEAALLAGLPASPTTFSPFGAHPELARARQEIVLRRMFEDGKITFDHMETALSEMVTYQPQVTTITAPHFVMWLRELLVQKYGEELVAEGGLEVKTTLDMGVQKMAEAEVEKQLLTLQWQNVTNGAAMVTSTTTGEVLAMVGSRDYWDTAHDGNVNVCLSLRQPGSSIKVVNYAAALEDGFKANTIIQDAPISYPSAGGPSYTPANYDGRYHGAVTLRTALASSYNIPAVKVLATIGVPKMVAAGVAMGLDSWKNVDPGRFGLSLTLGGIEVRMAEMMEVYSTLGNTGRLVKLSPILEIKDSSGHILESSSSNPHIPSNPPIIKPAVAYTLTKILSDNNARAPAFGTNSVLNIAGFPDVAVKTGTTNSLRDNWTFGYTPDYTVGVWVGNNDNSPMSAVASGITGASPIWHDVMFNLIKDRPNRPFDKPATVVAVNICPYTGTLACAACPGVTEYFAAGTEPKQACNDEQIKKYQEEQQKKADEAAKKQQ